MGNIHEMYFSEQDRQVYKEETAMDRHNNNIGLRIAREAKTEEDIYRLAEEAIKNKEDEETIKTMQDQVDMLKEQVEMMGGLGKSLAEVSGKNIDEAIKSEEKNKKRD